MSIYDRDRGYWLKKARINQRFLSLVELSAGDVAIDVGCGNGRLAKALKTCVGLDYSAELVAAAREAFPDIAFYYGDVNQETGWSQLPDFNVVVSNMAIRQDGCKLPQVVQHGRKFGTDTRFYLRIQGDRDLPGWVEQPPFYSRDDIIRAFGGQVSVEEETYQQSFSSYQYFRTFAGRIGIKLKARKAPRGKFRVNRHCYLVAARD